MQARLCIWQVDSNSSIFSWEMEQMKVFKLHVSR